MATPTPLFTVLTLVLVALATACDGNHGTVTAPTTAASTAAAGAIAQAGLTATEEVDIAATLAAGGFSVPAFHVNEIYTKVRPTYTQVYEPCLIVFAVTGAANGRPIADTYCHGLAVTASQQERPNWNEQRRSYYACVFMFTVRGVPGGVDLARTCHGPDAAIPPD